MLNVDVTSFEVVVKLTCEGAEAICRTPSFARLYTLPGGIRGAGVSTLAFPWSLLHQTAEGSKVENKGGRVQL